MASAYRAKARFNEALLRRIDKIASKLGVSTRAEAVRHIVDHGAADYWSMLPDDIIKRLNYPEGSLEVVHVRMSDDTHKALKDAAAKYDTSLSALIRMMVLMAGDDGMPDGNRVGKAADDTSAKKPVKKTAKATTKTAKKSVEKSAQPTEDKPAEKTTAKPAPALATTAATAPAYDWSDLSHDDEDVAYVTSTKPHMKTPSTQTTAADLILADKRVAEALAELSSITRMIRTTKNRRSVMSTGDFISWAEVMAEDIESIETNIVTTIREAADRIEKSVESCQRSATSLVDQLRRSGLA